MEFHVKLSEPLPEADRLAALVEAQDPSAITELDDALHIWRVSTTLRSGELVELLERAGCPTSLTQVTLLPSVCCGGCSG